jgi:D-glycero-D-manno-heptose 1,7-bisphosphate phosphatase
LKKAIFLDRDGVINEAQIIDGIPNPPKNVREVRILPGVKKAVQYLKNANYEIIVVTNQPDIARGKIGLSAVDEINALLSAQLNITSFYICPHDDGDNCECRKPKSGLLLTAGNDLDINFEESFMVGDRWRDVAAGQGVGCKCFFINHNYTEKLPSLPYIEVKSLLEASKMIIKE